MTSQLKSFCYLLALSWLIMLPVILIANQIITFSVLAIVLTMTFIAYWYSDTIALHMNKARKLTEAEAPSFYTALREQIEKNRIPMPQVYCIPTPSIKTFTAGRNPKHSILFVTEGLVTLDDPKKLQKKLANQMIHIPMRSVMLHCLINAVSVSVLPIKNLL